MKVGIVTFEFPGFTKNGGIGTAYGRLANLLVQNGHSVVIYYLSLDENPAAKKSQKTKAPKLNPKFKYKFIQVGPEVAQSHSWALARSVAAYERLRNEKLDVLHFHDCMGLGWCSIQAQKWGLAFEKTQIVLGMHGPNFWVNDAHGFLSPDPHEYLQNRMEQDCVEAAQHVVSPSQYLLDYLKSWDWKFPQDTQVIPNVNDLKDLKRKIERHTVNRFVFFGRLESRKGIVLFLDALKLMTERKWEWFPESRKKPFEVIFMGRDAQLPGGEMASSLIQNRMNEMSDIFKCSIHENFSSEDCRKYFSNRPDSLICLPSLADNSPYAVVEALEQDLNFIATSSGGQSELIHPDHRYDVIAAPTAVEFSRKMIQKVTMSYPLARPAPNALSANQFWLDYHRKIQKQKRNLPKSRSLSLSVVVLAREGGLHLNETLQSILSQEIKASETLVYNWTEKGKVTPLVFEGMKILYQKKKFRFFHALGATAENLFEKIVTQAKSPYVLILNEGDVLEADALKSIGKVTQRSSSPAFLFGLRAGRLHCYPHPLELNHSLFFDDAIKYPLVFKRQEFSKEKVSFLWGCLGFTTKFQLEKSVSGKPFENIPKMILKNSRRVPYHPYWHASAEQVRERLNSLSEIIPRSFRRNLELAASFVVYRK